MKPLKPNEQKFWDSFLHKACIADPDALSVYAGMPGDERIADELVSLYLNGRKTAASGLVTEYEKAAERLPRVGDYWILLDSRHQPRCIVKTLRVEKHRFKDVGEDIARAEGEGDLSVEYWRRAHRGFFGQFLEKLGIRDLDEELLVVEYFEVVFPAPAEKTPAAIAHAYDRWSPFYDTYPNPTVAIDELVFPELWSHLSDQSVLEIGCGTGRHTKKLVAQGNRVTAVDPSAGMLERARAMGLSGVEWICGDFMEAELGSYDSVVCSLVLEHIQDLDGFFAKVAKSLRPGGEFWLSEIHPSRAQQGALAHFSDPAGGEEIWLGSYVHGERAVVAAAEGAGFKVTREQDGVGGATLVALRPEWVKYQGVKMVKVWGFVRVR